MRRSLILTLLLALSLPVATMAQSGLRTEGDVATASGAYEAEVPVNSQAEADRNGALARALSVVLGKLSGDRNAMSRPGVVQALRNAKDYVASYDYKQDQSVGAGGAPSFRTLLVARFREDDVDSLVSALGLPLWPQPRPKPVLWLAVDDGSGPRLVSVQQANAARPLLNPRHRTRLQAGPAQRRCRRAGPGRCHLAPGQRRGGPCLLALLAADAVDWQAVPRQWRLAGGLGVRRQRP